MTDVSQDAWSTAWFAGREANDLLTIQNRLNAELDRRGIVSGNIRSTIAARDSEAMRLIVQKHYAHIANLCGPDIDEQTRGAWDAISGLMHEIDTLTSAAQDGVS